MRRIASVLALSLMAACATSDAPRLDNFNSVDLVGVTDFRNYESVHLLPPVAGPEVERLTTIRAPRLNNDDQPLDEADIENKLGDFERVLRRELSERVDLVNAPGPGVVTIRPILTELQANRPDLTRAGARYAGVRQVFSVGDAAVTYEFYEDGKSLGELKDSAPNRRLDEDGMLPAGVWQTADRFFTRSALDLATLF